MKKIIAAAAALTAVFSFCACSKKEAEEFNTSTYIIEDKSLEARDGEMLIVDGRNYYVLTFENDRVKTTAYALHYLDPVTAREIYDAYKKDLGTLYTDVRLDDTYLILTYSDSNENSLNGLSRQLIEQIYGNNIVK